MEGARRFSTMGSGGLGAFARAEGNGWNDAGRADVFVRAFGGTGGQGSGFDEPVGGGQGGDAIAVAEAVTEGDAHAVRVGNATTGTGAFGGEGGIDVARAPGAGGSATSTSSGRALGDSEVSVLDVAVGGRGGGTAPTPLGTPQGVGANGGEASSFAEGHNAGAAPVAVIARAGRSGRVGW